MAKERTKGIKKSTLRLTREDSKRLTSFTEQAQQVIDVAFEETRILQHSYIGTEHLLIGLLSVEEGVAARVLLTQGLELQRVRSAAEDLTGYGDHIGEIAFSFEVKSVIELACEEAQHVYKQYVNTEHLLLGLTQKQQSTAMIILDGLGVNAEQIQAVINQILTYDNDDIKPSFNDYRENKQENTFASDESFAYHDTVFSAIEDAEMNTFASDESFAYHSLEVAPSVPLPLVSWVKSELVQLNIAVANFGNKSYVRELTRDIELRIKLTKYQKLLEELTIEQYSSIAAELSSECLQHENNFTKLRQKIRPKGEMEKDIHYFELKADILAAQSVLAQAKDVLDQNGKEWIAKQIGMSKQEQMQTERGRILHQIIRTQGYINQLKSLLLLIP